MNRRFFLKMLATAPIAVKMGIAEAFNPNRVYFDMGAAKRIWTPDVTLDTLNSISQQMLDKVLADNIFTPSPLFWNLTRQKDGSIGPARLLYETGVRIPDFGEMP